MGSIWHPYYQDANAFGAAGTCHFCSSHARCCAANRRGALLGVVRAWLWMRGRMGPVSGRGACVVRRGRGSASLSLRTTCAIGARGRRVECAEQRRPWLRRCAAAYTALSRSFLRAQRFQKSPPSRCVDAPSPLMPVCEMCRGDQLAPCPMVWSLCCWSGLSLM